MSRRFSRAQRLAFAVETAAAKAFQIISRPIPTRLFIPFCGWLGARIVMLIPAARKRIGRNLDLVRPDMPPAERAALMRAVGDNFARLWAEYMRLGELARDPDLLDIEGAEHVTGAVTAGKGVVLVSAHFGNWEFARVAAGRLGAPTAIIYRAFNNPGFDAIAQGYIREAGEPVLHKGRTGSRGLVRHVAGGGAAMILIDQRQTGAPRLPFLGHDAETATAAAALALRTGAALIPARATRLPDGRRFRVGFEAAIPHSDAETMTRALNDRISAWIDEHPGQWFWLHRRWGVAGRDDARAKRIRAARSGERQ